MRSLPEVGPRMYKRYILGMTPEEIAAEEGTSARSVYFSLVRGKELLRKVFVECGVIE